MQSTCNLHAIYMQSAYTTMHAHMQVIQLAGATLTLRTSGELESSRHELEASRHELESFACVHADLQEDQLTTRMPCPAENASPPPPLPSFIESNQPLPSFIESNQPLPSFIESNQPTKVEYEAARMPGPPTPDQRRMYVRIRIYAYACARMCMHIGR